MTAPLVTEQGDAHTLGRLLAQLRAHIQTGHGSGRVRQVYVVIGIACVVGELSAGCASQAPVIVAGDDSVDASYFSKDFAHSSRVAGVRAGLHSVLHSTQMKKIGNARLS